MKADSKATVAFSIQGNPRLHCEGCEERVTRVLRQVPGVKNVEASWENQEVRVAFDRTEADAETIEEALERMGYRVEPREAAEQGRDGSPETENRETSSVSSSLDRSPKASPKERRFAPSSEMDHAASEDGRATKMSESTSKEGTTDRLQVKIGGIECSFCVGTITKALLQMEGVESVHVNMAHEEALVVYDPSRITPTDIKETLRAIGYTVRDVGQERTVQEQEAELRSERRNLVFAAVLAGVAFQFMVLMWLDLLAMDRAWSAMIWLAPTLALSTMFGPGWRFLNIAWASLKRGIWNQHVLMECGAAAGLVGGFLALVVDFPESPLSKWLGVDYPVLFDFFGVVVFINTYHILSAYVSLVVRTRASQAVRRLLDLVPPTATVIRDDREVVVPVEEVERGELVRVRPGESIPLDGEVVDGMSGVDESLVTGESIPREKQPGDEVIGGSLVQTGTLLIRVTRVGAEGFVQQVARQVEEARALKPGVLVLVDRVLQYFVPGVLAFAVAAFLIWTIGAALTTGTPEWTRALLASLAVLVMGYPCALGMATPLAMIRGGGKAAERGVLMRSGEAFQVLKDVRKVFLDKTGTVTQGKPAVTRIIAFGDADADSVLSWAAAAEWGSEHPLGQAVVAAAEEVSVEISRADTFEAVPGKGVRAHVGGDLILVGKPRFLQEEGVKFEPEALGRIETLQREGDTVVLVGRNSGLAGLIAIADPIKPDAKEAVSRMRQAGLVPVMLTGDHEQTARAVAEQVGIDEYRAEVLPHEKTEAIRAAQQKGERVVMVGDGINDAPALMQADVGMAIGAGTDIAIESADVVLIGDRLGAVMDAYVIGRESYKKTVQNLVLAFSFNGIGVPLAVTGWLHPIWAMIAMAASVTAVLLNSFGGSWMTRLPSYVAQSHKRP